MSKDVISVGDEFTVDFIKNKRGGKPICRINGMVGFIDNAERSFVAPCSSWIVQVTAVKESCLVVKPLLKMKAAKENIQELNMKVAELSEKLKKASKLPKVKSGYMYKSFAELQAEK